MRLLPESLLEEFHTFRQRAATLAVASAVVIVGAEPVRFALAAPRASVGMDDVVGSAFFRRAPTKDADRELAFTSRGLEPGPLRLCGVAGDGPLGRFALDRLAQAIPTYRAAGADALSPVLLNGRLGGMIRTPFREEQRQG